MTIVHRFLSPAWYETLKQHLAGARPNSGHLHGSGIDIFHTILGLETGEALLFSPTSILDVGAPDVTNPLAKPFLEKLEDSYIKLRIRNRVTTDGGKSIMASDAMQTPLWEPRPRLGDLNANLLDPFRPQLGFIPFSTSRFGPAAGLTAEPQRQPNTRTRDRKSAAHQIKPKQQPSQSKCQPGPKQSPTTKEQNVAGQAKTIAYTQTLQAPPQHATQQNNPRQSTQNENKAPQLPLCPASSPTSQVSGELSRRKKAANKQRKNAINQQQATEAKKTGKKKNTKEEESL